MSRIRTIKPEFWTSEQIVECSPIARLLFIGTWNFCDDYGNHPLSLKALKMKIFPNDEVTLEQMQDLFDELLNNGLVSVYSHGENTFFHVVGWRHQKIDRPTQKFPQPAKLDDDSTSDRRAIDDPSPPEGIQKGMDTERIQMGLDLEKNQNKTHASMQHESCRNSVSNRSDDDPVQMTNISREHVRRIVREHDAPLFRAYFDDAVKAEWAKDCDADRNTMAALFHQVVRIGKAMDPGRVICKSWRDRKSTGPKTSLKLAKVDEEFATQLLRVKDRPAGAVPVTPMRTSDGDFDESRPISGDGVKTQVSKLHAFGQQFQQKKLAMCAASNTHGDLQQSPQSGTQ